MKMCEKTIDFDEQFRDWDTKIERLDEIGHRLIEIEKEYDEKFKTTLQKAMEDEVDFKAIYGGNTEKTRKKYVDEQLYKLLNEKEELKLEKEDLNRRISYIKKWIELHTTLVKYQ